MNRSPRRRLVSGLALIGLVAALLAGVPLQAASAVQVTPGSITIDGSPTQLGRISRNAVPAACGATKVYPGILNAATAYPYNTKTFVAPQSGCLTVVRNAATCPGGAGDPGDSTDAHVSIYAGGYDPAAQDVGYLGDQGASQNAATFGVDVIEGESYTIVASNTVTAVDCTVSLLLRMPPDTTITSGAGSGYTRGSESFSFTGTPDAVSFACAVDGGAGFACTSPLALTGLLDGAHSLSVTSSDADGLADGSPATITWVSDTVAPDTAITSPTDGRHLTVPKLTATLTSPDGDLAGFACVLDGAAAKPCSSPATFTGLADGTHLLLVRAFDLAENYDQSAAGLTVTVCNLAPKQAKAAQAKKKLAAATKALKKAKKSGKKAKVKAAQRTVASAKRALKRANTAYQVCKSG
ncbi:hypothetical protein BH11ACT8_BH11ACT8_19540 [soil metagenome]